MGQAVVLQLAFYAGTIHLSKGDGEMSENDYSATGGNHDRNSQKFTDLLGHNLK